MSSLPPRDSSMATTCPRYSVRSAPPPLGCVRLAPRAHRRVERAGRLQQGQAPGTHERHTAPHRDGVVVECLASEGCQKGCGVAAVALHGNHNVIAALQRKLVEGLDSVAAAGAADEQLDAGCCSALLRAVAQERLHRGGQQQARRAAKAVHEGACRVPTRKHHAACQRVGKPLHRCERLREQLVRRHLHVRVGEVHQVAARGR